MQERNFNALYKNQEYNASVNFTVQHFDIDGSKNLMEKEASKPNKCLQGTMVLSHYYLELEETPI